MLIEKKLAYPIKGVGFFDFITFFIFTSIYVNSSSKCILGDYQLMEEKALGVGLAIEIGLILVTLLKTHSGIRI